MTYQIATIVGARPQFIKAAALSRSIGAEPTLTEDLIHTGQHFDDNMSDRFFRDLAIPAPRLNLGIHGGHHGEMTGRMLEAIESVFLDLRPDLVLVYGDTNSTLAAALAAAKLGIPVAHVEAGLRSFNRRMPEEINRVLVDHLSALLFCPTFDAVANLRSEGVTERVFHTGDVMFDATLHARDAAILRSEILQSLGLSIGQYVLCTVHRSENTDDEVRLRAIFDFVRNAADGRSIVFPLHPRTSQVLNSFGIDVHGLTLIDPVGYFDMHRLISGAALVLTDSGGVQKEAYFHRVPCVTLRDDTEWTETVTTGWNRLWTQPSYVTPRVDIPDYGMGDAAKKIVALIREYLSARPTAKQ